ncbi:MAG: BMP family ABC transporter substrate-binding protein [Treponema sp.]|nr:BMP family ABC transporter substrate-binding protein [Treponema sp.]
MKKTWAVILVIFVLISINCASAQRQAGRSSAYELALIINAGSIDDESFNQGSWEGLVRYATEKNIAYKYYEPAAPDNNSLLSVIDQAVAAGAKVIVTPGYTFETAVFIAQDRYPDTRFILIDSIPNDGGGTPVYRTGDNTVGVLYAEDQAGFLAGYAAVKDGYSKLGFFGGTASSSVIRYGYGFIQGAEYAARELRLPSGSVTINYHYTGSFAASAQVQSLAASWFNNGVEVIFACGGDMGSSVIAAAEAAGGKVIGVDIDQSGESPSVITSAMKMLQTSVYDCIASFYSGAFPGGQTLVFHAANNGVGLPMSTSRFRTFNLSDYNNIYRLLSNGAIPRIERVNPNGSPAGVQTSVVIIIES